MTEKTDFSAPLRVSDLKSNRDLAFAIAPEPQVLAQLANALDLVSLRKLRFEGVVRPVDKSDWSVTAQLGATVVQPCIVTLEPVTTRIEEEVTWHLVKDWQMHDLNVEEIEMPEDDTRVPLGDDIDLMALMQEALALYVPTYPRSPDASPTDVRAAPPGVVPMSDQDVKPFAGLSELKKRLEDDN